MRSRPPDLAARSSTVLSPVIIQSVLGLLDDSLLRTSMIFQVAAASQSSVTDALTCTCTIRWLGGHNVSGTADAEEITGAERSSTVTKVEHESLFVRLSVSVTVTLLVPNGNTAAKETPRFVPAKLPANELVCATWPFTSQTTVRGRPLELVTSAVTVTGSPQLTLMEG